MSPATDLKLKWRLKGSGEWHSQRFPITPNKSAWQNAAAYLPTAPHAELDQIALGISENVIHGDIWISSISLERSSPRSPLIHSGFAHRSSLPRISVPGLRQEDLVQAFELLDEALVEDVPAYGFPHAYIAASGSASKGGLYGDYWWSEDSSASARAASWLNEHFAANSIVGFGAIEHLNPDGRISIFPWEAAVGQPSDVSGVTTFFFPSAYTIAERTRDKKTRLDIYETMKSYLDWFLSPVKRDKATGLITGTYEASGYYGWHDMWYGQSRAPVMTNVDVAHAASLTSELAKELGKAGDCRYYFQVYQNLRNSINTYMWDERSGSYYDYVIPSRQLVKVQTFTTFYPLIAAIAPLARRDRMIARLLDRTQFGWRDGGVPVLSLEEHTISTTLGYDFWTPWTAAIVGGLDDSGQSDLAAELNWAMLKAMKGNYVERYPLGGHETGSKRYSLSAAEFISGIIEELFGVSYDARNQTLYISPHIPVELYGRDIAIESLPLPSIEHTRVSIYVKEYLRGLARIRVNINGPLQVGSIKLSMPGRSKSISCRSRKRCVVFLRSDGELHSLTSRES